MYSDHRHQDQFDVSNGAMLYIQQPVAIRTQCMPIIRLSILPRNPFYFDKSIKNVPINFYFNSCLDQIDLAIQILLKDPIF